MPRRFLAVAWKNSNPKPFLSLRIEDGALSEIIRSIFSEEVFKHSYPKTVFCWGSPEDFWRYVVWKNSNPETALSLRIWSRFSVEVFKNSYPETVLSRRRPEDFWQCGMKEFQFRNGFEPKDFLRRYLRILIPKQC